MSFVFVGKCPSFDLHLFLDMNYLCVMLYTCALTNTWIVDNDFMDLGYKSLPNLHPYVLHLTFDPLKLLKWK